MGVSLGPPPSNLPSRKAPSANLPWTCHPSSLQEGTGAGGPSDLLVSEHWDGVGGIPDPLEQGQLQRRSPETLPVACTPPSKLSFFLATSPRRWRLDYRPVQSPRRLPRGEGQARREEPGPWARPRSQQVSSGPLQTPVADTLALSLTPTPGSVSSGTVQAHWSALGGVRSLRERICMAQRGKRGPSRPPAAPPAFVLWALPPEAGLWPGPPPTPLLGRVAIRKGRPPARRVERGAVCESWGGGTACPAFSPRRGQGQCS